MNLRKPLGLSSKGRFPPEYRYWTYSRLRGLMVGVSSLVKLTVRALTVQVGDRAADKIVFSMAELTGNIWMMENISE